LLKAADNSFRDSFVANNIDPTFLIDVESEFQFFKGPGESQSDYFIRRTIFTLTVVWELALALLFVLTLQTKFINFLGAAARFPTSSQRNPRLMRAGSYTMMAHSIYFLCL
jgi:hypothetical protein